MRSRIFRRRAFRRNSRRTSPVKQNVATLVVGTRCAAAAPRFAWRVPRRTAASRQQLPFKQLTMRAWPVARSIFDAPYVREANVRTTSWIRQQQAGPNNAAIRTRILRIVDAHRPSILDSLLVFGQWTG